MALLIVKNFKSFFCLIIVSLLYAFGTPAEAQELHNDIEAGVVLGEPTGLSAKFWRSGTTAFDAAVAWSFGKEESLHLHANYLLHNWLEVDEGVLNWYYGLGARVLLSGESRFGARVPVGMQYFIPSSRLGLFFEVAPIFDLVPSTEFGVNGGIGIRYFL